MDGFPRDYDLVLMALTGEKNVLDKYHHTLSGNVCDCNCFRFLTEFAANIRSRLYCHERFVTSILCGMATGSHVSPDHMLTLLNQGQEASSAYKKLITEYVGVPMGKELRL